MSDDGYRPPMDEVRIPGSAAPPPPVVAAGPQPVVTAGLGSRYLGRVLTNLVPVLLASAGWTFYSLVLFNVRSALVTVALLLASIGWTVWQCQRVGASGANQARRLPGVAVVDQVTGQPIGFGRSMAREFVPGVLSLLTCGIFWIVDAIMALAHPERLSAHDRIFKTRVIRLDSMPPVMSRTAVPGPSVALPSQSGSLTSSAPVASVIPAHPGPQPPVPSVPPTPPGPASAPWAPPSHGVIGSAPGVAPIEPAPPAPVPPSNSLESATRFRPPIKLPSDDQQQPVATIPVLVVDHGQRIEIRGTTFVGRNPAAPVAEQGVTLIAITDPAMSLSKTHAAFGLADDGSLWVEDRASTNGVALLVDGQERPVTPNERTTIPPAAALRLGDRRLTVERPARARQGGGGVVPIDGMPSSF